MVRVPVDEQTVDDLQIYGYEEIAPRARISVRQVQTHAADPACPLKLKTVRGSRRKACDAPTLRRYLAWLLER